MKLPLLAKPLILPQDYYHYWFDYGRCKSCRQEIRHELHLYNHYRKYHWHYRARLHYYVWYDMIQEWVEVSPKQHKSIKRMQQRPTAIAKEFY
jgi:hypothetical protein